MIDGVADRAGGAVDLFERRRDLFEEENRAGSGKGRVLLRDLLSFSRGFTDPQHGRLGAPSEGVPAKARRERPFVGSESGHQYSRLTLIT